MNPSAPIIFLGMHRSGTSLICRLLERLGLFVGKKTEGNNEAVLFQDLNKWILRQIGVGWDNPAAIDFLLADGQSRQVVHDYLRISLRSLRATSYLGWARFLRHGGLDRQLPFSWGWKDPRNTFTLPLWLDLYPRARIIYIERHGVDVAQSLKVRRDRTFERARARYRRLRPLYYVRSKKSGFSESVRCASLEGGFSLWCEYVARGRDHVASLGPKRAISVRYEDLLSDPVKHLNRLTAFCGLACSQDAIQEAATGIRGRNAFAFRRDPSLVEFAHANVKRLGEYQP